MHNAEQQCAEHADKYCVSTDLAPRRPQYQQANERQDKNNAVDKPRLPSGHLYRQYFVLGAVLVGNNVVNYDAEGKQDGCYFHFRHREG